MIHVSSAPQAIKDMIRKAQETIDPVESLTEVALTLLEKKDSDVVWLFHKNLYDPKAFHGFLNLALLDIQSDLVELMQEKGISLSRQQVKDWVKDMKAFPENYFTSFPFLFYACLPKDTRDLVEDDVFFLLEHYPLSSSFDYSVEKMSLMWDLSEKKRLMAVLRSPLRDSLGEGLFLSLSKCPERMRDYIHFLREENIFPLLHAKDILQALKKLKEGPLRPQSLTALQMAADFLAEAFAQNKNPDNILQQDLGFAFLKCGVRMPHCNIAQDDHLSLHKERLSLIHNFSLDFFNLSQENPYLPVKHALLEKTPLRVESVPSHLAQYKTFQNLLWDVLEKRAKIHPRDFSHMASLTIEESFDGENSEAQSRLIDLMLPEYAEKSLRIIMERMPSNNPGPVGNLVCLLAEKLPLESIDDGEFYGSDEDFEVWSAYLRGRKINEQRERFQDQITKKGAFAPSRMSKL